MRDPQGQLTIEGDRAVRRLAGGLSAQHFLRTPEAQDLVADRWLMPFEWAGPETLHSPAVPVVTHPTEWCDGQFDAAARLTLDIAERVLANGHELKDASTWNVVFVGTRPVFCDHLSFEPVSGRLWWAAGQYGRHFVVPLWLSRRRRLNAHRSIQVWRDGVPPEVARSLLGPSRYLSRCWPLVAGGQAVRAPTTSDRGEDVARFRARLHTSLRWMLDGVRPRVSTGEWTGYVDDRPQYPGDSLAAKRSTVAEWLSRTAPRRVLDLGCNTGEFSELALAAGAEVVAVDADHGCVEALYRRCRPRAELTTVVAALDDVAGGRGWDGAEHAGLARRLSGRCDLAMALALTHHLMVAASIPVETIARSAAAWWSSRWLVHECIHPEDPQMRALCGHHRRDPLEFGVDRQLEAFESAGWRLRASLPLAPAQRTLWLLERAA